jgi:peptidyl-prolyl cis-trans isomerase B (cyclophilin B)
MEASPQQPGTGSSGNRSRLVFVGIILAGAMIALVIALVGGEDKSKDEPGNASCTDDSPAAGQIDLSCPDTGTPPLAGTTATVKTSEGDFTIDLATDTAPATTASFVYMAENGAYKDNSFTRIAPGFVIQGGDPTGTQAGNAGFTITEAPPADQTYPVGTVAMAKAGTEPPGTSGSQFFVVIGTASPLTPDYAVLGKVGTGMDVVDKIAAIGTATGGDGAPKRPVKIDDVTINAPSATG